MNIKHISLFLLLGLVLILSSCAPKRNLLSKTIATDPVMASYLTNPDYEVQIIYTQVNLKDTTFATEMYNVAPNNYFYPASTVALPVAALTLQRKNEINRQGTKLTTEADMFTAKSRPEQSPAFVDETNASKKPNLQGYIQKSLVVGDQNAFNRLYEFLGQDYINESLQKVGAFSNSRIAERLGNLGFTAEDNKHTNDIRFFKDKGILYDKPASVATKDWYHTAAKALKGKGYKNNADSLVMAPLDFSKRNFYSLQDMENTLKRIIFPNKFPANQRFDLLKEDYDYLRKCISDVPSEYDFYKDEKYVDGYAKYFLVGGTKDKIPGEVKVFNKSGESYGYLVDCAYIEHKEKNIGFFLTAVIYVNKDQLFDDTYEYNEKGFPFMNKLSKMVYDAQIKK